MRRPSLVDPRRSASMTSLFPQRVTLQTQGGGTVNRQGAKNPGQWTAVDGLSALPCSITALERGEESNGAGEGATAVSTHRIEIQGYCSAIHERMRAVDDETGAIYNILLADSDPHTSISLLKCRRVSS